MNKNRFTVLRQDSSPNILPDKLRVAEVENSSVELGQPFSQEVTVITAFGRKTWITGKKKSGEKNLISSYC
jgi:hypothetical protein